MGRPSKLSLRYLDPGLPVVVLSRVPRPVCRWLGEPKRGGRRWRTRPIPVGSMRPCRRFRLEPRKFLANQGRWT